MTIENRVEVGRDRDVDYATRRLGAKGIAARRHRSVVGGRWEEMGRLQLDFVIGRGLRPEHRFIDVGCGSLRAGRKIAAYLEPEHYYGVDVNAQIIELGYEKELDDELRRRLPTSNLRSTDRFDVDFGVPFDMGIAQSVFSHLSLNHLRLCLARVARSMKPGGRFFVTYFEQPSDFPVDGVPEVQGRKLFTERNFYWYYRGDLAWATTGLPWQFNHIGEWGHPRQQVMAEFVRTAD